MKSRLLSLFPLLFSLGLLVGTAAPARAQVACGVACPADTDGDGVDDSADECVDSPPTMAPVSRGCAAGELVTHPEVMLRTLTPAFAAADKALDNPSLWGERDAMAQGLRKQLDGAQRLIVKGVTRISQGGVCAGAKMVTRGAAKMEKASVRSGNLVLAVREDIVAAVNPGAEDADGDEVRFHEVGYRGGLMGKAVFEARSIDRRAAVLCTAVVEPRLKKSGRVVALNDAIGLFTLDDGTRAIMASKKGKPSVQVGMTVDFPATRLADGTLLMLDEGTYTTGIADIDPGTFSIPCMALRLAPIQPFPPLAAPEGAYVLHDPDGYRFWSGELIVENGMRVGAASLGCPTTGDIPSPGSSYRYSLRVEGKVYGTWQLLASDLEPGDAPVSVPLDATTLRITNQVQVCTGAFLNRSCSRPSAVGNPYEEKLLKFSDRNFGSIYLAANAYDLATALPWQFAVAELAGMSLVPNTLLADTTSAPEARAYSTDGSKTLVTVNGSSPEFALYREDDFGAADVLFGEERFGVTKPGGVAWPRLIGSRGGKPFWYLLDAPNVIRDAVADCGSEPDTYHKVPWRDGATYTLGQGNNGAFSHTGSQAYAFDFSLPEGTKIRASRGGVVEWLQESQTATYDINKPIDSKNQPFPGGSLMNWGNAVRIRHDDGTWSWYFHIQENGVLVEAGDTVERGQPIALSGNTGRSTNAHLHFQVQDNSADWGQSVEVTISSANLGACRVPQSGDSLESDNANPYFP